MLGSQGTTPPSSRADAPTIRPLRRKGAALVPFLTAIIQQHHLPTSAGPSNVLDSRDVSRPASQLQASMTVTAMASMTNWGASLSAVARPVRRRTVHEETFVDSSGAVVRCACDHRSEVQKVILWADAVLAADNGRREQYVDPEKDHRKPRPSGVAVDACAAADASPRPMSSEMTPASVADTKSPGLRSSFDTRAPDLPTSHAGNVEMSPLAPPGAAPASPGRWVSMGATPARFDAVAGIQSFSPVHGEGSPRVSTDMSPLVPMQPWGARDGSGAQETEALPLVLSDAQLTGDNGGGDAARGHSPIVRNETLGLLPLDGPVPPCDGPPTNVDAFAGTPTATARRASPLLDHQDANRASSPVAPDQVMLQVA
jgi:hypothetical protein